LIFEELLISGGIFPLVADAAAAAATAVPVVLMSVTGTPDAY
jgi:hypothetical protein